MVKPYGTWPSPISAQTLAAQGLRLSGVSVSGDDIYWIEGRPAEGGRNVLVRLAADGRRLDLTPAGFNVRTRVHEYGGGAYLVDGATVYFSNFADQRVYRIDIDGAHQPEALTPEGSWCYADFAMDPARRRLVCVREDHTVEGREAVTTLVSIALPAEGRAGATGAATFDGAVHLLADGYDFYSTPRVRPDGRWLSWICWRHPRMPWDGTELWVGAIAPDGSLTGSRRVAGGDRESIYQPGWSPDGGLYFASDRDDWWRLYRVADPSGDAVEPVLADPPAEAEFGRPQWIFGTATWAFATPDRLVVSYTTRGQWRLGVIDVNARTLRDVPTSLEPDEWLAATATHAVLVAGSPTRADAVMRIDLNTGAETELCASSTLTLDAAALSVPEPVEFPTGGGLTAHAFYYPPRSAACTAPVGERPPLIVIGHGGPIAAAQSTLDLKIQYWTSRGFAVADVNYGGSTGYGRAYRERLNGQWGIVDVADLINAAQYLVREGKADPDRLIIRGGSAGGYTVLVALTMHPEVFKAGASYYGISDLEVLASDSHKFESRCLDILVGPYPAERDTYRARSPIYFVDRLECALILLQGLEDKVVPPNQSEMMAEAARAKGCPVAYLAFEGEQHGFRRAETIIRSQEAELYFYGAVFGFTPADVLEPVPIDNLPPHAS
jgi:dipeptidyl aminopeptidase/acylaminoacyl peptidase